MAAAQRLSAAQIDELNTRYGPGKWDLVADEDQVRNIFSGKRRIADLVLTDNEPSFLLPLTRSGEIQRLVLIGEPEMRPSSAATKTALETAITNELNGQHDRLPAFVPDWTDQRTRIASTRGEKRPASGPPSLEAAVDRRPKRPRHS